MQMYKVVGEYGPQGDMNITLEIEAENEGHARNQFCEIMEIEYPHEWKRMGRRNVHCMGVVPPKTKPKPPQTTWFVKYKGGLGFYVFGVDLFAATAAAEKHIEDHCLARDSVLSIEYLAY